MTRFTGSGRRDDSGVVRPGDEETGSIGKTVYYSPQEEGLRHSHEGEGHDESARPAQEAEER